MPEYEKAEVIHIFMKKEIDYRNWEVLIVSFDGWLRAFLVSQTDGYKLHSSFRFPGGVGAVAYSEPHNTLYVAGVPHRAIKVKVYSEMSHCMTINYWVLFITIVT